MGIEDGLALPDDADELGDLALDVRARLVVVDPLTAHLTESVNSLRGEVEELGLPHGIERALRAKLGGAQRSLDAGRLDGACGKLGAFNHQVKAFNHQVKAQSGKKIARAAAADLIDEAAAVRESLGCKRGA